MCVRACGKQTARQEQGSAPQSLSPRLFISRFSSPTKHTMGSAKSIDNSSRNSSINTNIGANNRISFGARSPFIGGGIGGGGGDDEKGTMQNLNDRLATYLEDVWSLENGNAELELRIREFLENKTSPGSRDYSAFFVSIADLHNKIHGAMSTDTSVEADFAGLKRVLDVLAPVISVEMDLGPTQDLNAVLSEIRKQYEQASAKNKKELNEVAVSTETNLNRLLQSLQREHQSQLTMKGSLEGTLQETENQVTSLEEQLVNLQGDIDRQGQEYQMLLDTKTCLEMEIAEYRRLLDEGDSSLLSNREITAHGRRIHTISWYCFIYNLYSK
uniref:IF rod domain-containing protein n=1 Tax=Gadus morhua TaxID=8049 RepID=A0A8C5AER6_GADMO